jgi:CsbD-like.
MKNETEKMMGKAKEKAGQFLDDNELEFKGKLQNMKGTIENKTEDIKDKMYEKANDVLDKVNWPKKDDKRKKW